MTAAPLVSVVMPMHNAERFVAQSIRSVLAQTVSDWELLIIDDASQDDSRAVAERAAGGDSRIQVLSNPGPNGAGPTRNVGIEAARGRFIAFLDSDDMWLSAKLEKQLALLEVSRSPLVYSAYYKISGDWAAEAAEFTPTDRVVRPPLRLEYKHMLRQDYIGFLTAMYDTEVLGKRHLPAIKRRQDYALMLELLREGHVARGLSEPLALYRAARSGSLSSNKFVAAKYNWHIYRHVEALPLPRALWAFGNYAVRAGAKYLI